MYRGCLVTLVGGLLTTGVVLQVLTVTNWGKRRLKIREEEQVSLSAKKQDSSEQGDI